MGAAAPDQTRSASRQNETVTVIETVRDAPSQAAFSVMAARSASSSTLFATRENSVERSRALRASAREREIGVHEPVGVRGPVGSQTDPARRGVLCADARACWTRSVERDDPETIRYAGDGGSRDDVSGCVDQHVPAADVLGVVQRVRRVQGELPRQFNRPGELEAARLDTAGVEVGAAPWNQVVGTGRRS